MHRAVVLFIFPAALCAFAPAEPGTPCERVLPEPMFPRALIDPGTLEPPTSIRDEEPEQSFLASLDGREVEIVQTLAADLDGDGLRDELLIVEGYMAGFPRLERIPRTLHRVTDLPSMEVLWSQELPPGLAGSLEVRDIDGDGREDIYSPAAQFYRGFFSFNVLANGFQLMWSEGDEPLTVGQRSGSMPSIWDVRDINHDGLNDLIVTLSLLDESLYTVYPGITPRTFAEFLIHTRFAEGASLDQPYVAHDVADLNNDGLDDVLTFALGAFGARDVLAISVGDGSFEIRDLPQPEPFRHPYLSDLDGDGNVDLIFAGRRSDGGFFVGWGLGTGEFEPFEAFAIDDFEGSFFLKFGDIDGDGSDDILLRDVATVVMDGRRPSSIEPVGRFARNLVDIDSDGLADLVGPTEDRTGILWARSRGDGTFDAPEPLETTHVFDRNVGRDVAHGLDFDADGVNDLLVELRPSTALEWRDALLRGLGDGRFEFVWQSGPFDANWRAPLLIDIDADGRPDWVSHRDQPESDTWLTWNIRIYRGNGLGFDTEPMDTTWMSFAGSPGRFRTTGTVDMVRVSSFGNVGTDSVFGADVMEIGVNPSLGYVNPRDMQPPTVEFRAVPGDDEDVWRIATLPLDDCTSSPKVTDRRIALVDLPFGSPFQYRPADSYALTVSEDGLSGLRGVAVEGPDRATALALLDEARHLGLPFDHMAPMVLRIDDAYGPTVGDISGTRRLQRFEVVDGRVVSAEATYPGADLRLVATAEDDVQSATTESGFVALLP